MAIQGFLRRVSRCSVQVCNLWYPSNASQADERGTRCLLRVYQAYLLKTISIDEVVVPPKGDCRGW